MFHVKQVTLELRERDTGYIANLLSSLLFAHDWDLLIQGNHPRSVPETSNWNYSTALFNPNSLLFHVKHHLRATKLCVSNRFTWNSWRWLHICKVGSCFTWNRKQLGQENRLLKLIQQQVRFSTFHVKQYPMIDTHQIGEQTQFRCIHTRQLGVIRGISRHKTRLYKQRAKGFGDNQPKRRCW